MGGRGGGRSGRTSSSSHCCAADFVLRAGAASWAASEGRWALWYHNIDTRCFVRWRGEGGQRGTSLAIGVEGGGTLAAHDGMYCRTLQHDIPWGPLVDEYNNDSSIDFNRASQTVPSLH